MNFAHIRDIREYEVREVTSIFPEANQSLLEIGAGAGWQAKLLSEQGFRVQAIDIAGSAYAPEAVWPVIEYDGKNIPFSTNHFDFVFSSNVLEHIPEVEAFQSEIRRVLKPTGKAVHIIPSGSWRLWTGFAFYPYQLKHHFGNILAAASTPQGFERKLGNIRYQLSRTPARLCRLPPRHGISGTALTEIVRFSRLHWKRLFRRAGWEIEHVFTNRLFYTGYSILDTALSIEVRHLVSRVLGSSCNIYVLRPRAFWGQR